MAIENKLKQEQESKEYEFRLEKERKEAERKRIEAQGIKDFQDIVSEGISDRLLKWKGIESTLELAKSQNTKIVVIGNAKDGLPLILGDQ
jgi:regulator of protease activity HflC (stomatin/prohibitin superfamily)